jgi:DNA polymerase III epsilon subunit-like protein
MISIDCEMTGLDFDKCAVISVGAIDLKNPERRIYIEMQPFDGAEIVDEAMAVNGFTKDQVFSFTKTQKEGLEELKKFLDESESRTVLGQNVATDVYFLNKAFERAQIECRIPYRVLDLHSMICAKLLLNNEGIPMLERKSTLNLDKLLNMAGIPEEPKPHIAINGALSAAEVYFRLIQGKAVLPEFTQYEIRDLTK